MDWKRLQDASDTWHDRFGAIFFQLMQDANISKNVVKKENSASKRSIRSCLIS